MSPRMALTTAWSDSPSKLKLAEPELAPRFGGGALAALRLMTVPVPRRTIARGVSSGDWGSAWVCTPLTTVTGPDVPAALDVPAGGACVSTAFRCTVGVGMLPQATRVAARKATSRLRKLKRHVIAEALYGFLTGAAGGWASWRNCARRSSRRLWMLSTCASGLGGASVASGTGLADASGVACGIPCGGWGCAG